jgi:hypothetical protein
LLKCRTADTPTAIKNLDPFMFHGGYTLWKPSVFSQVPTAGLPHMTHSFVSVSGCSRNSAAISRIAIAALMYPYISPLARLRAKSHHRDGM